MPERSSTARARWRSASRPRRPCWESGPVPRPEHRPWPQVPPLLPPAPEPELQPWRPRSQRPCPAPLRELQRSSKRASRPAAQATRTVFSWVYLLKRFSAGLAGADADGLLEIEDEDLAVADLAGVRGLLDGFDRLLEQLGFHRHFDLHLGQEVDDILCAAVQLGMALLPAESLHFRDRDALHADGGQRLAHFIELERLDDGRN